MTTTDTPRTDSYYAGKGCECSAHNRSECGCDVDWTDPRIYELQAEVERLTKKLSITEDELADAREWLDERYKATSEADERAEKAEAEVERLKELLNRAINEIEKTPFNTPKLTAFTAHRLAERYRDEMTNNSTKPIESQEDDK